MNSLHRLLNVVVTTMLLMYLVHASAETIPTVVAFASPSEKRVAEEEIPQQDFDLKGQITYIYQKKSAFNADYTLPGFNSLLPQQEQSHSLTTTAYLGFRPWSGAEVYVNGEMVLGVPFSGLTGLASVPNSELQKAAGPNPLFYSPRTFLRQTWDSGSGRAEHVESGINQLAGSLDKRRLVLSVGKLSIVDISMAIRLKSSMRTKLRDNRAKFAFLPSAIVS